MQFLKQCNTPLKTLESAKLINHAATHIRDTYIEHIAKMTSHPINKNKNIIETFRINPFTSLWWFSLLAEKSATKSDGFNQLARLDAIVQILKKHHIQKIIFSAQSPKLKKALQAYSQKQNISFKYIPSHSLPGLRRLIRNTQRFFYIKHLLLLFVCAIHVLQRTRKIKQALSHLRRPTGDQKSLVIITGFPNFDLETAKKNIFKNNFYPSLQPALEAKDQHIIWLAQYVPSNLLSFNAAMEHAKSFTKNKTSLFFIEEFNTLKWQIKSLYQTLRMGITFKRIEHKIQKLQTFGDYNFYAIFKDDWHASFMGATGYMGLVHYGMYREFLKQTQARRCLYIYEMQSWEKGLIALF